MNSAAISTAGAQFASIMAAAAMQKDQLGLAEAQINASEVAGGGTPEISPSASAPGTLSVYV